MKLSIGAGYIVLDGDPAPPKGAQPPIFGPCLLWTNGWMEQDATWYRGRPRFRRHCLTLGPPPPKGGTSAAAEHLPAPPFHA